MNTWEVIVAPLHLAIPTGIPAQKGQKAEVDQLRAEAGYLPQLQVVRSEYPCAMEVVSCFAAQETPLAQEGGLKQGVRCRLH
jgi:hypothetical protein